MTSMKLSQAELEDIYFLQFMETDILESYWTTFCVIFDSYNGRIE